MTATELIRSSLRLIGKLGPGQTTSDSQARDAIFVLNSMLDAWNADRFKIYQISRALHSLVASTATYTIGSGGTFNVARPARIERAGLVVAGTSPAKEEPLKLYNSDEWADIEKKTQEGRPSVLYDDFAFPLSTLSLWKVPDTTHQLALYTWSQLSAFTDLTNDVTFPPGYQDALRYNLALRLAPEWGIAPRRDVMEMARSSRAAIESENLQRVPVEMKLDPSLPGTYGRFFDFDNNSYRR
jgi:hypothetical protein